jgi:hypothetical protein
MALAALPHVRRYALGSGRALQGTLPLSAEQSRPLRVRSEAVTPRNRMGASPSSGSVGEPFG